MNDIMLYSGNDSAILSGRTRRDVAQAEQAGLLRAGRVDIEQAVAGVKIAATGGVIRQANAQAAIIARQATMLAEGATPWEADQIATVARAGIVGLANITQDSVYAIGRI